MAEKMHAPQCTRACDSAVTVLVFTLLSVFSEVRFDDDVQARKQRFPQLSRGMFVTGT